MTADEVKKLLGLTPHPREGGSFLRTYESSEILQPSAFERGRYGGPRNIATAIYYLLEPDSFSRMHRLGSDEMFHFYAGDPIEMLQLQSHGNGSIIRIGNNLERGERPQVLVRRGIWQGSRLAPGGAWALLGCTVSPGFTYSDYETGSRAELSAQWPAFAERIADLTPPVLS
jgi:predicted cupin superfamily sugar epimerase